MRKIMGTLAIAVLALTACGAPAETSSIQPLVASAPEATIQALMESVPDGVDPDKAVEEQFVSFAASRAQSHSISDEPSPEEAVAALHAYCEDGMAFALSVSADYNENLKVSSDNSFCDMLSN